MTFNLFPARQKHDWSWAGDEINSAFLLEGLTRALIRQHVLIEDFSENVAAIRAAVSFVKARSWWY